MTEHDELLPIFIEESQQHLQNIEPDLLALEQNDKYIDAEAVNRIFRGVHSIKGAAGFFGFQNIGKLSHVMENTLSLLRDKKITPTSLMIDTLFSGIDALKAMLDDAGASEDFDIQAELDALQKIIDSAATVRRTVTVAEKAVPSPDDKNTGYKSVGRFSVSEADIRHFISKGLHLYAIKIYLNEDLRHKEKTPYDFINDMESMGQYVDSFLDISSVTGLTDCLDNDLAFDFLFATMLSRDSVSEKLGLSAAQVRVIDLDRFRDETDTTVTDISESGKTDKPYVSDISETSPDESDEEPNIPRLSESLQAEDKTSEDMPKISETSDKSEKNIRKIIPQIQTEEKIRVGVSFLNELVNLAGELVLGRNQLMQATLPLIKHTPGLNPVLQHISRVTSEMQEKIMQMRMQPVSLVFDKFHRVVRSLAKNHNKEVRLLTSGREVELDKSIIEGLSDPLTHLIRNAVDHGIETPEVREKAGKPRYGSIYLKAYHQGGQVHLEISDDGRGINGDFVARTAFEKGIIDRNQLNNMNEKDRVRLIFQPGFSTAEQVTDLSGRGVGMDVVITNIEHLGGTVDIETVAEEGTNIKLVLPLTLAIVSGLLLKSCEQYFILPEVDIDELVRIKPDEISTRINIVQEAWVLRLRDMLLPLVNLNEVLGLSKKDKKDETCATHFLSRYESQPMRILVIKQGASRFGLVVDSIESTEEIVVKPLPRYLKKMKTFSGVSILGNGKVSLILDVAGILKKAAIRNLEETEKEIKADKQVRVGSESQTLLLFDNNTEERFALPLELISRIERVAATDIERIKDRQFLQYHDKKLRLIFLEDYLPINRPRRSPDDCVGVIIPKQIKHPVGIIIHQVINTVDTLVDLDTTTIIAPGLFGTAVLDGKITLLPDMYRLFEMAAPEWYANSKRPDQMSPDRKYRVLLAEDTPFFRMVESEYLVSAGYEVIKAEDGKKALQFLEEQSFDAVLLDIVMPKMDGWDVIKAIRADKRLRHLPVMAVTSLSDENLAQKGMDAGFNEWELKLDKTRMLEKLAAMLGSELSELSG